MMKKIIGIVLAVVLIAGGLGGFVYAQATHEPMTGQKLVGWGGYAEWETDVILNHSDAYILLTNPDGVSEIAIDRISVFTYDGILVYEGPLRVKVNGNWGEYTGTMTPHQTLETVLSFYDLPALVREVDMIYTVEIFWSQTDEKGLPLIGWVTSSIVRRDAITHTVIDMELGGVLQMVNMEQVLKPEKEKEVTTLRLQTWQQPDDPLMQPLENFVQAVAESSGGSVQVELYPAVPLGEIAEAVRQGEVEMGLMYSTVLQYSPNVMDGGGLPFLYNDDDGLMAAVQAGIGDLMSEALQEPNITVLDWTTMGFSHLFSRETMLDEPSDVAGLKIRVPNLPIRGEAISQWGGTPITMASREMYMALEDGLIHGATFPLHAYDAFKLYEVAPYFCVDYAFGGLAGLGINSDVWKSLDAETRKIIRQAAQDFAVEMLETVKQVDADALATIESYGVEVYELNDSQRAIWRAASQPVWDSWVLQVGPVGLEIIATALEHNPLP